MNFIVYSKPQCPYCYKVKTVLELCAQEYTLHTLDEDFTKEEFYSKFGNGSTFPQVIVDDRHLGGCTDTIQYLKELSLIKS
jgi:glutaredoxin